jgi:hypothetical protein
MRCNQTKAAELLVMTFRQLSTGEEAGSSQRERLSGRGFMRKLDTPVGMLLTVAILLIVSAYAFLIAIPEKSWMVAVAGVVAVIGAVGTALLKPWSRYLVYLTTAGFIIKLAHSVYAAANVGYFGRQLRGVDPAVRSLAPAILLGSISLVCCWVVHRHYSRRATPSSPSASDD